MKVREQIVNPIITIVFSANFKVLENASKKDRKNMK